MTKSRDNDWSTYRRLVVQEIKNLYDRIDKLEGELRGRIDQSDSNLQGLIAELAVLKNELNNLKDSLTVIDQAVETEREDLQSYVEDKLGRKRYSRMQFWGTVVSSLIAALALLISVLL